MLECSTILCRLRIVLWVILLNHLSIAPYDAVLNDFGFGITFLPQVYVKLVGVFSIEFEIGFLASILNWIQKLMQVSILYARESMRFNLKLFYFENHLN